jgi:hypothetical protein
MSFHQFFLLFNVIWFPPHIWSDGADQHLSDDKVGSGRKRNDEVSCSWWCLTLASDTCFWQSFICWLEIHRILWLLHSRWITFNTALCPKWMMAHGLESPSYSLYLVGPLAKTPAESTSPGNAELLASSFKDDSVIQFPFVCVCVCVCV